MVRQNILVDFLIDNHVDAIFIQKDENCRYISGFTGSDSYLFVAKDRCVLITDSRYTEQAKAEAKNFEIINHKGKLSEVISNLVQECSVLRLGVESVFSYQLYTAFERNGVEAKFNIVQVDSLRKIKTEEELKCIARACSIADEAFEATLPHIKEGISEMQLMAILESEMLLRGSSGKSFDTIVASGLRGSYPHGTASDKLIKNGDLITFDFGAIYNGYHSDMTRTIAVGEISAQQKFIYDAVEGCVEHVESMLKAGIKACDAHHTAVKYLNQYDLDQYFTHALGHSVGLEVHESPVLSPRDETILCANMIETVEPGVYIPGVGGVRIEDTVIINEDGNTILTKFPKKFLRV